MLVEKIQTNHSSNRREVKQQLKFSKRFKIASRWIGDGEPCFVVAEVGLNHNGELQIAKELIKEAKQNRADAVKFQKRDIDSLLTKDMMNKPYPAWYSYGETYAEHRNNLELSEAEYRELKLHADSLGIIFFASAWDEKSADFLETLNVPAYKIASADVTNLPLVEHISKKGKPMIMSTGMSSMREIEEALHIIGNHNSELVLLQCVSTYPSEFSEINLNTMKTLRNKFDCLIGYSGHELAICISEVAVALGACMVERHFTLNRAFKGPDHSNSLEPHGLFLLVRDIRDIEASMGNGEKQIVDREIPIRRKLGKSIVASCDILEGEVITRKVLTVKSPALGLEPKFIPKFLGRKALRFIRKDDYLQKDDVE